MMAMFNAGAAPAAGPLAWALLGAAEVGQDWRDLHPLLCTQRDAGVSQADLVAMLTDLLDTHPEHDDWLRDVLDMATGWCHPRWHVYPPRHGAAAALQAPRAVNHEAGHASAHDVLEAVGASAGTPPNALVVEALGPCQPATPDQPAQLPFERQLQKPLVHRLAGQDGLGEQGEGHAPPAGEGAA